MNRGAMFIIKEPAPNIFIGGVGASLITSPADYALYTNLAASNIYNFQIDANNNISFFTKNSHNFDSISWRANSEVTYLVDLEGKITGTANIRQHANVVAWHQPYTLLNTDRFYIYDFDKLPSIINYQQTIANRNVFANNNILTHMYLANATSSTYNGPSANFGGNIAIERLYLGELNSFSAGERQASMYQNIGSGIIFYNNKHNAKIYHDPSLGATDRRAWNRLTVAAFDSGDTITINGLTYTAVTGAPTVEGEFEVDGLHPNVQGTNLKNAINSDTRIGTLGDIVCYNSNSAVAFESTVTGASGNTVTASVGGGNTGAAALQSPTFFGGTDVHPCLMYGRDNEFATLIEVLDYTPPSSVTDLSSSNITSSGCDLNFTAPSSTNSLDFYEVWVERLDLDEWHKDRVLGRYTISQEITSSGDTISSLISGISYRIHIIACDIYWNRSEISNIIEITTL